MQACCRRQYWLPDLPKIYNAGDFFYEAPMQVHRLLRNLSQTEPAKLLSSR